MGVVYKAQDTKLDRSVALKFLPPHLSQAEEEKKRFIHEAKAASALDHQNICTIYEIDETEDRQMFIAMSYYEGETLKNKIEHGPLKLDEAIDIAIQVSEGLAKAHRQGIIHRDINPANIMITSDGVAKIVDFGLAKLARGTKLTKTGMTLGTVAYMSPEQTKGTDADHRTDIWALGVLLYEMVAGQQPFKADYEQAVMYSILNEDPEPLTGLRTGVPAELERIINKALAKNPGERYQHTDEMLTDLKMLKKQLESGITRVKPAQTTLHRKKLAFYTSLVAIFVLLIFLSIYLWQRGDVTSRQAEEVKLSKPLQVTLRQVTSSEDLEEYPSFSPDGSQIVYCRETEGYKHIFVKNLQTGKIIQLTKGTFDNIQPSWSPDGKKILFVRSNQSNRKLEPADVFGVHSGGDIWIVDKESGKEVKIIEEA
ncbi:MAG: protein kinase, partial [Verrucomicrobia bacterium]|nr:protein kinase [Verrucomicrobiota bacterium]